VDGYGVGDAGTIARRFEAANSNPVGHILKPANTDAVAQRQIAPADADTVRHVAAADADAVGQQQIATADADTVRHVAAADASTIADGLSQAAGRAAGADQPHDGTDSPGLSGDLGGPGRHDLRLVGS